MGDEVGLTIVKHQVVDQRYLLGHVNLRSYVSVTLASAYPLLKSGVEFGIRLPVAPG